MSTTITKKTRDEAILICAVAASTPEFNQNYNGAFFALDVSDAALELALSAWSNVVDRVYAYKFRIAEKHIDAEAEAMLRTGWSPT